MIDLTFRRRRKEDFNDQSLQISTDIFITKYLSIYRGREKRMETGVKG